MEEFLRVVDFELLPQIRQQLIRSHMDGYKQASIDAYVKAHQLTIADFGLQSGTIWIIRKENLTFSEAKSLGLQFPTEDQILELQKCKWLYVQGDTWHCHIRGRNAYEIGVFDSYHNKLCIWPDGAKENENFLIPGYVYENGYPTLQRSLVYAGDKYSTLFVLPKELQQNVDTNP